MPNGAGFGLLGGVLGMYGQWQQMDADYRLAQDQAWWNSDQQAQQNWWNKSQWERESKYNLEQWNRQNEYNSPQAQMARFSEAGLNPHLIYGQGTPGNSPSQHKANPLRSADYKPYQRAQARNIMEGLDVFQKYQEFKKLQPTIDNVEADTHLKDQQSLVSAQAAANAALDHDSKTIDLRVKGQLEKYQYQAAEIGLRDSMQQLRQHSHQANMAGGMTAPTIEKAKTEVKIAKSKLKGQDLQNELNRLEVVYKAEGIDKVSWMKIIYRGYKTGTEKLNQLGKHYRYYRNR